MQENPVSLKNIQNFELPKEIQTACFEIAEKCFHTTDPTKVSVRYLTAKEKIYPCYGRYDNEIQQYPLVKEILDVHGILRRKNGKYPEHNLITQVFRGILNVCQLIDDTATGKTYSLPLRPENIKERLYFPEIIADIILYQLLTGCEDRSLVLQDDPRTLSNEWIVPHNCRIFSQGSYSIFDIEGSFEKVQKNEVEERCYYYLKYLFSPCNEESQDFQEHIDGDIAFGESMIQRMLKNVSELLDRYNSPTGREFFTRQCAESHISHRNIPERIQSVLEQAQNVLYTHEEEYYENLIFSLKNIQDFFENSEEPFRNTNFLRRDAKRKIRYHMKKLFEYMKQYFFPRYTI